MDDDFSDRMTRQQAEHAMRRFAFPGWVCLGMMDMTAAAGGWGLMIAPSGETTDFDVYLSWRLWIQERQRECDDRPEIDHIWMSQPFNQAPTRSSSRSETSQSTLVPPG